MTNVRSAFAPQGPFEDVSKNIIGDIVERVFGGAREQLLVRLFDKGNLTTEERQALEQILREQKES